MFVKIRGSRKLTAERLGMSQVTLWRKLKELGISDNLKDLDQNDENNFPENNGSKISAYLDMAANNGLSLKEIERKHMLDTLKSLNGKKKEAAFRLGISKATLWRKLKSLRLGH